MATSTTLLPALLAAWWSTDVPLTVLTGVLAVTTGAYAIFTWKMVEEMRASRRDARALRAASIMPRLVLTMEHPTPLFGRFVLLSCGTGPAVHVDLTIDYGPGVDAVKWANPVMVPGTRQRFFAPERELKMEQLVKLYPHVRVAGTCRDLDGAHHAVDEDLDVADYWTRTIKSRWHHRVSRFTRLMRAVEKIAGVDSPVEQ